MRGRSREKSPAETPGTAPEMNLRETERKKRIRRRTTRMIQVKSRTGIRIRASRAAPTTRRARKASLRMTAKDSFRRKMRKTERKKMPEPQEKKERTIRKERRKILTRK